MNCISNTSSLFLRSLRRPSLPSRIVGGTQTFSSSSSENWIETNLNEETGIATVTMNRPPANSLSLEMCQAISKSIKDLEANEKSQAMILTSGLNSIFSAGLDLTELYKPDGDRLPKFWDSFQQVYLDLYGSRLTTIAAMNGHALAGGCMLALSCDYRIMSKGTIGLNESKLGIAAPPWLGQQYIDTIGLRQAELALSLGTMFDIEEAYDIQLVDEASTDDVIHQVAQQRATEWVAIPAQARIASKKLTRGRQLDNLLANRQQDIDHFCSFVTQEKSQRNLGAYLKQLAKRKK